MKFESVTDLLHFAISKERASQQFYRDLALQMKDSAACDMLNAIAMADSKKVLEFK